MSGLGVFRDPASVAVVGASADQAKWGYRLAAGAVAGAHRRRVELVSRRGGRVCGRTCVTGLDALDHAPELVVLCVPAGHVPEVVSAGLAMGVRGFLGITAGVHEERQLAARIQATGARLVGANSLGIVDTASDLHLAWGRFEPGPLAVVSQSGQIGSELAILGARHGMGISRFVSVGNASDVTANELLADLAGHEQTRVVAVYLESFTGGEAMFETLRALRETGKPTVLLTVGASAAGSRLALSHTGSLTSSLDIVDAACRAAGVTRVRTPGELIDVARTLITALPPRGSRVAIVGDSGGQCAVAADLAHELGLAVPTQPEDLAGAGETDLTTYATVTERMLRSDDVDAAVLTGYFGRHAVDVPALADRERQVAQRIGATVRELGKPVLVHTMAPGSGTAKALWSAGVPAFGRIEAAMTALRGLVPRGERAEPAPVPPVTTDANGYWAARQMLGGYGIPFPHGFPVHDPGDIVAAARQLHAPFVLKADWLVHKTERGGVRTGLQTAEQLLAAFDRMAARLGPGRYVVEEQDDRPGVVEILLGARRDRDLGPLVVVGAGGTEADVHRDLAMERAPVSPATALVMLERLRCAALLRGWRGRPRTDIVGLAELVAVVSQVIAASPRLAELELNPVRVGPAGLVAVDALVATLPEDG